MTECFNSLGREMSLCNTCQEDAISRLRKMFGGQYDNGIERAIKRLDKNG